ncbi:uncharacterized protein LOC129223096 [Uloborus diversus]|uniref:uncharacterized protein LOC129223096 n=1 Tax=Uloborus diversus TaxID=327109 RepID=UPI002408F758|nr:uncharacterized protein LOC129223096 [Uloborus diversus]
MDIEKYTPATLAIGATILTLTWLIFYLIKSNRNLPPGPWGLPIVGYYPFISSSTHLHFSELAKKYGNVFSFRTTGGNLVVVLNGKNLIKEVLISRSAEFIGRPAPNNLIYWITKGHGVTPSEGETWRDQRRFFLQIAKNFGFGKMEIESRIQEEVRDLLKELRETEGKSVDAKYAITCAVSPIISHILFNKKFKREDSTFKGIAKALEQIVDIFVAKKFFLLGLAYDFALLFLPELKIARKGRDFVQKATDKIVNDHVKAYDEQNRKDYVDEYIKHMDDLRKNGKLEKSTFSMEELRGNAMALFLEGTESISSAIWGWLLELSKHPHAQEVSQKELDNVVGRERLPSWMDRQNLPFYDAVLQETYRCASPFLVTTQYSNFEETSILNYRIPRRSTIVANLWSINSDPEIFPNPEKFDYERFVTPDGKRIKREGPYPYGLGKRACVGESLAQMEVFIFIASILQSFKLAPGDREGTLKLLIFKKSKSCHCMYVFLFFLLIMDRENYTSVALAIGASVLTLTWLIFYLVKRNRNLPPGPWGLPIVGYYPFISSSTHLHFSELAKKYGNIFSFRTTGGNLVVVLNGTKLIKEVLISRSAEFIGRPSPNNLIHWKTRGHGVTPSEGETWKDQRRFFLQIAKNFGFGKIELESRIQEEVRELLKELREMEGKSVDAKYSIASAASPIISHILFNKKFKKEDSAFKGIVKGLEQIVDVFVTKKYFLLGKAYDFALLFLPELKKVKQGRDVVHNATDRLVYEHVKEYDEQNRKDYVDEYIKHMDDLRKNGKLDKSTFSMEELRGNAMALFLEGTESISSAIWSLMLELSKCPRAQEVSQKELDNVVGRERLPSWMDRQNLPFFDAVLQEAYRCASPFFVSTQYSNFEETSILNYRIPRRSTIVANLWSINRDPEIFPNPEKFDYERFVTPDGKRIKRDGPYPFGVGKRSCMGESLAQMEVFIFIASILQSFKLAPGDREGTLKLLPRE